jgi:hypothetical protein
MTAGPRASHDGDVARVRHPFYRAPLSALRTSCP